MHSTSTDQSDRQAWMVVAIGVVALVVAMGIGRFVFTPLLPLMLRDGTLDAADGAQWAAANYAGYLIGALTARRFVSDPPSGIRMALIGVVLTTLSIALLEGAALRWLGAAIRALSGVFSAWVLVCASSWCLAELARRQTAQLGAWIYTGVGLGIAITGLLTWLGGRQPARWLWVELGLMAALGTVFVGTQLRRQSGPGPGSGSGPSARAPERASIQAATSIPNPASAMARDGNWRFVLCYGTFAFGYIVPATFLPAMARQQVDDPMVFGLTWPLFGLAATLSVAAAACWLSAWPRRRVWAMAQGVLGLGTALPLATQALWSLALSAVLVGGTFMVVTMAGLQLIRERVPENPTPLLASMTVAFATGQIAGPLLVRLLGEFRWGGWDALEWASVVAAVLLGLSSAWLWFGPQRNPGSGRGSPPSA